MSPGEKSDGPGLFVAVSHDDAAREALRTALEELGEAAEQVSIAIGMPETYLRDFLDLGTPRTLPNDVRRLAAHLGIPEFPLKRGS